MLRCIGKHNSFKTLMLIHRVKDEGSPAALLSIEAEKAFERVGWEFIILTQRPSSLRVTNMKWILLLYRHTTARVWVNGTLS